MRNELNIKFNEKDEAKKEARDNGTAIRWDGQKKVWYWEGEALPEFLKKYTVSETADTYKDLLYLVWREQYGSKIMYRVDRCVDFGIAGKKELTAYVLDFERTESVDIQGDQNALFMKTSSKVGEGKCLIPRIHNLNHQQVGEAIKGWIERGEV